jgi:uncharacterized protein
MNQNRGLVGAFLILGLALIVCTIVVARPLQLFVTQKNSIMVTGSAKKQIKSDLAIWTGSFSRQSDDLAKAYAALKQDQTKVRDYLKKQGFDDKDISFPAPNTEQIYATDPKTGMMKRDVSGYIMRQNVEVQSTNIDRVTTLSQKATDLIDQGIIFRSYPARYVYTKLNELKVDMLAEAAKDAQNRASKIVAATGGQVGTLRSAKMGVFQITAPNSNEVSDYGINDTSSIDKEITAVVNAEFGIK